MGNIRINTESVREASRRLLAEAREIDRMRIELERAIDGLDTWSWDGRSRWETEPLLNRVRPQGTQVGDELERLSALLKRVADTFEDEDQTAARNLEGMPWVEFGSKIGGLIGIPLSIVGGIWNDFWKSFHAEPSERTLLWRKIRSGPVEEADVKQLFSMYNIYKADSQFEELKKECGDMNSSCFLQGLEFITAVQPGTIGTSYAVPLDQGLEKAKDELSDGFGAAGKSLQNGDFLGAVGNVVNGSINAATKIDVVGNVISFGSHKDGNTGGAAHSLIGVKPGVFVESINTGPEQTLAVDAYLKRRESGNKIILQEVPGITPDQRQKAADFALEQHEQDTQYDYLGTIAGMEQDEKWYCSELAYESLKHAGVNIEAGQDTNLLNYVFDPISSYSGGGWRDPIMRTRITPHELETATVDGRELYQTYPR